jgi:hypothetical protein
MCERHTRRDPYLLSRSGEVSACRVPAATVSKPGGGQELETAKESVPGIRRPVRWSPAGFADGDLVPGVRYDGPQQSPRLCDLAAKPSSCPARPPPMQPATPPTHVAGVREVHGLGALPLLQCVAFRPCDEVGVGGPGVDGEEQEQEGAEEVATWTGHAAAFTWAVHAILSSTSRNAGGVVGVKPSCLPARLPVLRPDQPSWPLPDSEM